MRVVKNVLGVATLGLVLFATTTASGANPPRGGQVEIFITPGIYNTDGPIVVTGAIGDYGQTLTMDKNGKPTADGDYVRITLQKGTFEMNTTAFNATARRTQPTVHKATCSFVFSAAGPAVTLHNGTGFYRGISGTVKIAATFAWVGSRYKTGKQKGQCDLSESARPVAEYLSITGTGTVRFS